MLAHRFIRETLWLRVFGFVLSSGLAAGGETNQGKPPQGLNTLDMVKADGKLRLTFGEEILVLPRCLQPSLLRRC
jgi:hypothetical protein